jgi:hypothetical protein
MLIPQLQTGEDVNESDLDTYAEMCRKAAIYSILIRSER